MLRLRIHSGLFHLKSNKPILKIVGITNSQFQSIFIALPKISPTYTQVQTKTLYSNFINGNNKQVGIVTATGGTLIANGVTTVHSTRVFGTYLDNGQYAQILQSTNKASSKRKKIYWYS